MSRSGCPSPGPWPRRARGPRHGHQQPGARARIGASAGSSGANSRPCATAIAASARLAGNAASSEWPSAVAAARTGRPRPRRNAASSAVGAGRARGAGNHRRRAVVAAPAATPPVAARRSRSPRPGGGGSGRWRWRRSAPPAWRRAPRHGRGSRSPGSSRPSPAPCRRRRRLALPRPAGARSGCFHSTPPISWMQQHVGPLGVVRAADQEQVALARRRSARRRCAPRRCPPLPRP